VTVLSASPVGALDAADGMAGKVHVAGWSLDPDTTGPIAVHVYVDGVALGAVTADRPRADLGAGFPPFGPNHAYDAVLGGGLAPGSHLVCTYGINVGSGGNTTLGCRPFTIGSGPPIGSLDSASPGTATVRVQGWAMDPDTVAPIQVHVYVDGRFAGAGTASGVRDDLVPLFPIAGGAHAFDVTVSGLGGGPHTVCVWAINVGAGFNPQIGCQTVTGDGTPLGSFDQASRFQSTVTVGGWALDPDTASPIQVHVYLDGVGTPLVAGTSRPDIAAAFPSYGGAHGFLATLPIPAATASQPVHTVCAYAINTATGDGNVLLGCRTVL
jgi:hypothetical protein